MLAVTLVLARVLAEANAPAPELTDQAILVLKRQDIRVGNGCTPPDAGVGMDGGGRDDGGIDGAYDAAIDGAVDAGVDAGVDDAGIDAGDPCDHIPGDAITLVMQPRFSQLTTGARFAILMVTPSRPVVETTPSVFESLANVSAPVIREIEKEVPDPALGTVCRTYPTAGCGGGPSFEDPYWEPPVIGDGGLGELDGGYSLDDVGPYQVLRATPSTTAELMAWLMDLDYLVMPDDVAALAPYIAKGYTVVALRVALDSTSDGQLAPIALTWAGSEIRLPAAIGSPSDAFPMTVYIAAAHRYDLPGARVPFAFRVGYDGTSFLTRNEYTFDPTTADEDPVAILRDGDPEVREIVDQIVEIRVPVEDESKCGCSSKNNDESPSDGCLCNSGNGPRPDWGVVLGAIVFTLVPRRRRRR
ncbi:MAG: DUF2330 domain-containing protein [Kofleriaceae bacterium]